MCKYSCSTMRRLQIYPALHRSAQILPGSTLFNLNFVEGKHLDRLILPSPLVAPIYKSYMEARNSSLCSQEIAGHCKQEMML